MGDSHDIVYESFLSARRRGRLLEGQHYCQVPSAKSAEIWYYYCIPDSNSIITH